MEALRSTCRRSEHDAVVWRSGCLPMSAHHPPPKYRREAPPLFAASRIVKPAIEQTTWLAVGTHRPVWLAVRTAARLVREILKTS